MRAWSGARARRKRYGSLSRGEIGPPCFVVGTGQTFPHLPALPACLPTCCPHAVTEANLDNLPRSPESSSQPPFVLGSSNTCTVRFNEGPVLKRNMDPPSLSVSRNLFPAAFFSSRYSSTEGDASFILRSGREREKRAWLISWWRLERIGYDMVELG